MPVKWRPQSGFPPDFPQISRTVAVGGAKTASWPPQLGEWLENALQMKMFEWESLGKIWNDSLPCLNTAGYPEKLAEGQFKKTMAWMAYCHERQWEQWISKWSCQGLSDRDGLAVPWNVLCQRTTRGACESLAESPPSCCNWFLQSSRKVLSRTSCPGASVWCCFSE